MLEALVLKIIYFVSLLSYFSLNPKLGKLLILATFILFSAAPVISVVGSTSSLAAGASFICASSWPALVLMWPPSSSI